MKTFKDQLNRTFSLENTPARIVSLVPSQTELLYDLGLEDQIAGITRFCVHPSHFKKTKTIVGGTKKVKFNKIKELKPDIILCNKEENTEEMIRELEKTAPVHISDIYTVNDCLELIAMYGQLFSKAAEARIIIDAIKKKQDHFTRHIEHKPKIKTAYFIWKNPWMAAAKKTFIDSMLKLNNFENCYGQLLRYPEIDLSSDASPSPQLVLLSSEPYPFKEKHSQELQEFFPNARILLVDGEMFSWYGTRLLKAFDYFKTLHNSL